MHDENRIMISIGCALLREGERDREKETERERNRERVGEL